MKQIQFDADFSNTKWVIPVTPIEFVLLVPCACGAKAKAIVGDTEYPGETKTLYFYCENCEGEEERRFNFIKCTYTIEIPDDVEESKR